MEDKYEKFLEGYSKLGSISKTCKDMGISNHTFYNWMNKNSQFKFCYVLLKKTKTDNHNKIMKFFLNIGRYFAKLLIKVL